MIEQLLFRKKEILTGSVSLLLFAAALIGYLASGPGVDSYLAAENAYTHWLAEPKDQNRYEAMEKAFKKAPALKKKYESAIAQKLLSLGRTQEGLNMAHSVLKRAKAAAPLHVAFATATLLIEQGAYQQALEQTVALKEHMPDHRPSVLYAELLIRIAALHQQLENRPGEKAAWDELQAHFKADPVAADVVLGSFSEKQIDLFQYMAERQKNL
jgi:hypothetical protein